MQPFPNRVLSIRARLVSIFLYLIFLTTCRSTLPPHISENASHPSPDPDKTPVIFVPGIKGSRLVNGEGEIQWLTGLQALNLGNPDLRLKEDFISSGRGSTDNPNSLKPFGPVARVTAIPYILDVAIYDDWLRRMANEPSVDFYVFSYDWRKDNTITRSELKKFIEKISTQYKVKPMLVGHSMGGMLSFSVVNYNPRLVSKVVYVGVPFRGGIGYMRDLYEGVSTGLNSDIQSPCTIAKYQSVYSFFPRLNTWDTRDVALDEKGVPIKINFFQADEWEKYDLGFHSHACKPDEIPNPLEFERILKMAKFFRKSLDPTEKFTKNPPPSLVVTANNRKTREKTQITSPKFGAGSRVVWDMDNAPLSMGDGRVTEANSLPPRGFPYKKIYTEYEHSVMLNDIKVQDQILDFLQSSLSSGEQN